MLVAQSYQDNKPDSSIYFADKLYKFVVKGHYERYMAAAQFLKAWAYVRKGENEKAFPLVSESVKLYEKLNFLPGLANAYNAMGAIFSMQKDTAKSREYHLKALKIFEQMGDDPSQPGYAHPSQGDVWDFIGQIKSWVANGSRKSSGLTFLTIFPEDRCQVLL